MILRRIYKRVSRLCEMLAQRSHILVYKPVVNEKANKIPNSCSVSLQVRCFCSARLAYSPKISRSVSTKLSGNFSANRISRTARAEAQNVLFDYLHGTRCLYFTDAEYISRNSPHFLQNLMLKIDNGKNVSESLSRFLRYNPINEFEPFFESLGLSPSEISSLLPQNLIFLTDDRVLLENFHVLCDYGIPRSKMGKIYKETREIFGYEHVSLASKLGAYEKLDLSKATVIKLISCCPSLLIGGGEDEFAKVIEKLNRLGIRSDWIGGCLSVDDSYNWKRILDTMDFLDQVGYSKEKLLTLLKAHPALVFEGSGKKIYIWFGRLLKLGLKMDELYSLFVQNPQILSAKCAKNLLRAVDILFNIGMGEEDVANIVSTHTQLLCLCPLKGPKTICRELKINKDGLCQLTREDPMKFFSLASKPKLKVNGLVAAVDASKNMEKTSFLLRLGYVENSDEMIKALKKFRGRGDRLQERFDCLVKAGLDWNVVSGLIKHAPMVLNQTKDVIEKKIDCLINFLGYPLESIVAFPTYLCYDMERITQRFSMYMWLREKNAAKPMLCLSTILASSNARFIKYFVQVHPDGPDMWENLTNA